MTIVVEDGSGKPDAEVYCDREFADIYHSKRGNSAWDVLDLEVKEQCLVKATDYMLATYQGQWKGMRRLTTQSLDWPRNGVLLDEFEGTVNVPYYIVPDEVKKACAELALRAVSGPLLQDLGQTVTEETVGPLTVKYDKDSSRQVSYPTVVRSLSKYFKRSGNNLKLLRV